MPEDKPFIGGGWRATPVEFTEGNNKIAQPQPSVAGRFNLGIFLLTFFWCLFYEGGEALLCFIPFYNIYVHFDRGVRGNAIMWESRAWEEGTFHKAVRNWNIAGVVTIVVYLVIIILAALPGATPPQN